MFFFFGYLACIVLGQRCHFVQLQENMKEKVQRTESKQLKRPLERKDNIYMFLVYCLSTQKLKVYPRHIYIYTVLNKAAP